MYSTYYLHPVYSTEAFYYANRVTYIKRIRKIKLLSSCHTSEASQELDFFIHLPPYYDPSTTDFRNGKCLSRKYGYTRIKAIYNYFQNTSAK